MRFTVGQAIVRFLAAQHSEVLAPDSGSWCDVAIAEVSELESATKALQTYQAARTHQRRYL